MSDMPNEDFHELIKTMKRAAASLREAEVPFLLGGGMAWARGGPPTDHDVDLLVRDRSVLPSSRSRSGCGSCPTRVTRTTAWSSSRRAERARPPTCRTGLAWVRRLNSDERGEPDMPVRPS